MQGNINSTLKYKIIKDNKERETLTTILPHFSATQTELKFT